MRPELVKETDTDVILQRINDLPDKKRTLLKLIAAKHGIEIDTLLQQQQTPEAKENAYHANSASVSPLVTMRAAGSKTPFFCVHALLGSVFHYHHLANLMDSDQPFYGLQAPGLDGNEAPLDQIEKFAVLYLKEIRTVQPAGPYKLGGYSFGSWIAFQMAQDLIQQGEQIDLLVIMGTGVPMSVTMPSRFEQIKFLLEYSDAFEKNVIHPFLSYEQRIAMASEKLKEKLPPLVRLLNAHNKAATLFEPKPYPGRITLLETVDQQLRTPLDASRGWKRLSTEDVDTHLVSGNHLNMLDEPHVRDLAQKLTQCLNTN